ncbi:Serine/threonine phosphatase stp [Metamycoplasma cloacale]|uniref:Serine/threonine-protein phosphatase n=1 Tax=Metamycoplasma cloacale TaxID=92401 RepID=A0A2Z4LLM3_9BACT|nr:serine/threonine-protein phosphatase [Metamycoplasma cloacale]VEU79654.1 Serine/threonine phosphatase stp [Metamycoplasma cloacale]
MDFVVKSDKGLVRSKNEDRAKVCFHENKVLAMLCDGMGGHFGGDKCADLVIELFEQYFKENFPENVLYNDKKAINEWFINALEFIKDNLIEFSNRFYKYSDMGTTLTAALIFPFEKYIYVFNIGDSRTYIYNGLLHLVTEDQNVRNTWVKQGKLTKKEATNLVFGNQLTSCIGPFKKMTPDGNVFNKDSNCKYVVLTSDGLHNFVDKPTMEIILQKSISLDEKASELIEFAKKNDSNDNISVAIVEI